MGSRVKKVGQNVEKASEFERQGLEQGEKVNHKKVVFKNYLSIELAADIYVPKNTDQKLSTKHTFMNGLLSAWTVQILRPYIDV